MFISKSSMSINNALSSLKTSLPTINLRAFASAGNQLARIIIDVTHTSESRKDPSLVVTALRNKLENRFEAVANSFSIIEKGSYTDRMAGIVGVVKQIISLDDSANLKGFKAVASNMFMDDEKDMWVLKKTESGNLLIKTTAEDEISLNTILEAVASSGKRNLNEYKMLAAQCSSIAERVQGGDYVSFVDYNNCTNLGFVLATTDEDSALVLTDGSDEYQEIPNMAITDIHDQSDFPDVKLSDEDLIDQQVAVSSGNVDLEKVLNYYKKIYGFNAKFFKEFSDRLRAHHFF